MADETRFSLGTPATMAAGLRTPSAAARPMPGARPLTGAAVFADAETVLQQGLDRIANVGRAVSPPLQPPPESTGGIYYNPTQERYSIGGTEFGRGDYDMALQAGQLAQQPGATPTGPGWERIDPIEYNAYLSSIGQGRGLLGNVGMGFRDLGEGVVGGVGRGLQMLGAEGAGQALVNAGEAIGPTAADEARDMLIARGQGLGGKIVTAATRSIPTIGLAVGSGLGAAAGAVRLGATAGGALARGSSTAGVAASILPMELQSSWQAAEQGGYDTSDPEVQNEILYSSLIKTAGQTFAPAFIAGGFSPALRRVVGESAQRTMRSRIARGVGAGAMEGSAEAFAQIVDRVAFDPELRAEFNQADWAALAPLIVNKYGEEALVAFGAGFLLGGPLGALGSPDQVAGETPPPGDTTPPSPIRNVDSGVPTNMLSGASLDPQATPLQIEGPQLPLGLPAPEVAGLLPPPAAVTPPPTQPIAPAPPGSRPLPPMPEGLAGPVAEGYQQAAAAGPGYIPPVQAAPVMPPDFAPGIEPVQSIAQQRTDMPPGAQRLRQRPSERVETYAPATAPAPETALAEQLNRLLQQQARAAEAAPVTEVTPEIVPEPEPVATGEITPTEYDAALADWELVRAQQANPDAQPGLARVNKKAQREWVEAVRAGTADEELFGRLSKRRVSKAEPLVSTGATRTEPGPARTEVEVMRQQVEAARAAEAERQRLQGQAAALRALGQRIERVRPEVPPLPANAYGTPEGQPFKTKGQANAPTNRKRVAEQLTQETDQQVTPKDLEVVKVPGGWALQIKAAPATPTPPKGGKKDAVQKSGAKASALRQGPKARGGDGAQDTKGQGPTGEGQAQTEAEPEAQEQQDVREADVTPAPEKPAKPKKISIEALAAERAASALSPEMEVVAQLEDTVLGAKKRKTLTLDELNAGVELYNIANGPDVKLKAKPSAEEQAEANDKAEAKVEAQAALNRQLTEDQRVEVSNTAQARRRMVSLQTDSSTPEAKADVAAAEVLSMVADFNVDPDAVMTRTLQNKFADLFKIIKAGTKPGETRDALNYAKPDNFPNVVRGKIEPRERGLKAQDGRTSLADYNTLDGLLDENKNPVKPMAVGKLQLTMKSFFRNLAVKPKSHVFKNQADLRTKNPKLYARATAARPQGDFDTVNAAAYFFDGNNVIVFSDRIANTGHLNAVLAHETMGHFGMRAIVGNAQFDSVMNSVYKNSTPEARTLIDTAMAARNLSKAEATEEYLSDYAARIENNILSLWWNKVKNALNKIGVRFGDEQARYLLSQARRYIVTGQRSTFFDAEMMGRRTQVLEQGIEPTGTGRFSSAADMTRGSVLGLSRAIELAGGPTPKKLDGALAILNDFAKRKIKVDLGNAYDTLKSEVFTPTLWRAIRSEGGTLVWNAINRRYNISRTHINKMQVVREKMLRPAVEIAGKRFSAGITEEQKSNVGKALKAARIFKSIGYKPKSNPPKIFKYIAASGEFQLQEGVVAKLKENRPTRQQFKEGIEIKLPQTKALTAEMRAQLVADRDVAVAAAPTPEAGKLIAKSYDKRIKDNSYTEMYTETFTYDFTDAEWDGFNGELDAMADTSVALLESTLTRYNEEQDTTYKRIQRTMNAPMTDGDRKLIQKLTNKFVDVATGDAQFDDNGIRLRSSIDMRRAEALMVAVNKALLGTGTDRIDALFDPAAEGAGGKAFFDVDERADIEAAITDFRTRYTPPKPKGNEKRGPESFVVQQEVRSLANELISTRDAEVKAVRDIETNYVPFTREGSWQARIAAVDENGVEYAMTDRYRDQTVYMQFETQSEADTAAESMTELFGEGTHTVEVFDPTANNGLGGNVLKELRLVSKSEAVLQTASTDPEINMNEATRFLRRFSINLDPARAEQIILALTSQNDFAVLRQLKASFVPGADNDLTQAISQHIESRASTIARNKTSVELANVLDRGNPESDALWKGSQAKYDALKAEYEASLTDTTMNEDAKLLARRKFDQYHSWFVTNEAPKRGNQHYNEFRKLVTFLDQQKQVLETDMASGKTIGAMRTLTAMSFLGGSVASGALNLVGLATNVPAALATYNAKNGYGGGFGWDAFVELKNAAFSVGFSLKPNSGADTAAFWSKENMSDADLAKRGMTRAEADFLVEGIESGFLDAAQFNSLAGSARGRVTTGARQTFVQYFMAPFNSTEQHSRRAAALAAFRLEFRRRTAAGANNVDAAKDAAAFAETIVNSTLGDYTTGNRPAFFRGGIQQFAFMFKQFVVNSATLIANLPRDGKIIMLGSLLLLSGLRGVPFSEDLEDVVDTLAFKFGIPVPSIREYLVNRGNEVAPGFGQFLVSGGFNNMLGSDIGARTGLGNILPGTEMFLPGAEASRVFTEVGGPMASFFSNSVKTTGNLLDIAPGGMPGDVEKTIRESPISMLRAFGDVYAYERSGAIVDRRGYVVSDDYNAGVAIMRALGLYPLGASSEYDIVRIGQRRQQYQRSYSTAYRDAIVKAEARGDRDQVRYLYERVEEWNRYAAGTGLEIPDMRSKVRRALRAQRQLASERFINSTSLSVRPYIEAYTGMYLD